jgi:hypothetical protein
VRRLDGLGADLDPPIKAATSERLRLNLQPTQQPVVPTGPRLYFGGQSLAIAARTVFPEIPSTRAIGAYQVRC